MYQLIQVDPRSKALTVLSEHETKAAARQAYLALIGSKFPEWYIAIRTPDGQTIVPSTNDTYAQLDIGVHTDNSFPAA